MQDSNQENNYKDIFSNEAPSSGLEIPDSTIVSVSEDINPLTSDINKIDQNISSGVVGKKETPRKPKFFVSNKSMLNNNQKEDELLSLYVGRNYNKISNRLINFSSLIFCPFYYIFRKMFIFGILIFIGLLFIHQEFNNYIIDIVYYLVFGLIFNILYMSRANRKVSKIKTKHLTYDTYSLGRLCSKKGGTSILLLIVGFIINLVIFIAFCTCFYLEPMTNFLEKYGIIYSYESGKIEIKYDKSLLEANKIFDDEYGYHIIKSDVPAKDYFIMITPNNHFTSDSNNNNYKYAYTLGNDSKFDGCKIELFGIKGYSSSEKFISAVSKFGNEEYNTKTINNIKWYYIYHDGTLERDYFYTTMIDDKIFLLKYSKDNTGIYDCLDYEDDVLNSVRLK